ncbi:phosphate ABC transporter substrate-binding protein PstS family protein [bacterium]|nr:phosphate ABC transporter substrate-binding protein PstS family protein [bacterium]
MKMRLLVCLLVMVMSVAWAQSVTVDPDLPSYTKTRGVSGSIKSIGSDTMNNLMALWSEDFRSIYPSVQVEIEGKGSSTAPPALIAGTSNFGPMSRAMKSAEQDAFEANFGYQCTHLRTAIDMLAVFVHKDNPIEGLTLEQLSAIFAKNPTHNLRTWGDLGLTGEWANKPISLYGRNSASGTYGFFKKNALAKLDFKDSVKEQAGSSAVIQAVARDKYGIGYSGIGYKTADVRAVPLSADPGMGGEYVEAIADNAYTGEYPLARFLYLTINYKPGSELDPLRREFVTYVFSHEGQLNVVKDGYYPVTAAIAREDLESVGITPGF